MNLERLVIAEQVPLQDIVILGGHSLEHTSIGANPDVGRFHIVNRLAKIGAMEIAYFTYMKYKGCESKVVILLADGLQFNRTPSFSPPQNHSPQSLSVKLPQGTILQYLQPF